MDKAREIRAILAGRINYQDGAYVAADKLLHMNFQGVYNGSFAANLFGVNHLIRHYRAKDPTAAVNQALNSFRVLGRPVLFRESPQEMACLVRPAFGNPSIMTLEQTESGLLLNVYTARALLAQISRRRAVGAFERHLPQELRENLEATNEVTPKEPKEKHKAKKARKKAEKWAKKAENGGKHVKNKPQEKTQGKRVEKQK